MDFYQLFISAPLALSRHAPRFRRPPLKRGLARIVGPRYFPGAGRLSLKLEREGEPWRPPSRFTQSNGVRFMRAIPRYAPLRSRAHNSTPLVRGLGAPRRSCLADR